MKMNVRQLGTKALYSSFIKESAGRKTFRVVNVTILLLLTLICLLPFINVIAMSFSSNYYVSTNAVTFWPKGFTLTAYEYILTRKTFWTSFLVSLFRMFVGAAINLTLITLTAYPLSKDNSKLRFRSLYAWYFFVTMLISGGMIPNYLLISALGMRDSLLSLMLPVGLPIFSMVLMLNFFRQVPNELEEAALIDGAGHLRTLIQIYIPVSIPAIATISLFCMVFHWNSWFDGMIYINSLEKIPLQTYLRTVIINMEVADMTADDYELYALLSDRTVKCSQIIIASIPILSIYPFVQRYFVTGIVLGSVKG